MAGLRWFLILATLVLLGCTAAHAEKPRVIVLTDIENEPDDQQSLVRFLVYSNQWDVAGLIATTSTHLRDKVAPERIRALIRTYGRVQPNLLLHEPGFPSEARLLSVVRAGLPGFGLQMVGSGKDSSGSELIVAEADRKDHRPLWVLVWGGPNVLAQALWKLRETRTPAQLARFVSRLRVFTISDQDDSGPWLRTNFPKLFYIASPGVHAGGGYHASTWAGISGDRFHGRFSGPDFAIVDNPWLDANVRSKGPLGAEYPQTKFIMEGDSSSFLYLIGNGLGDPEHPDWGSWGGRYELYRPRTRKWFALPETRAFWSDAEDEVSAPDGNWHTTNKATIWRWRQAYQNDFAARMDWTIRPYRSANHPPAVRLAVPDTIRARPGQTVTLSAQGTTDPDGDRLSYRWFYYGEAGSFTVSQGKTGDPIDIADADAPIASFVVPAGRVMRLGTMHMIVAVTDDGTPALTRYRRIIVNVQP
jgi:hypothetical protein